MKSKLHFILLNGAIGSGKSTIGDILEKKLKRTVILEIEDVRQFMSDYRQGKKEGNDLAWKIIYRMCDEYLKNKTSVLLKQTACSQELVDKFLRLAKKYKCIIGFYHLQAPRDILLKRVKKRKIPKILVIKSSVKHDSINYRHAKIINTSYLKPKEAAELILKDLGNV